MEISRVLSVKIARIVAQEVEKIVGKKTGRMIAIAAQRAKTETEPEPTARPNLRWHQPKDIFAAICHDQVNSAVERRFGPRFTIELKTWALHYPEKGKGSFGIFIDHLDSAKKTQMTASFCENGQVYLHDSVVASSPKQLPASVLLVVRGEDGIETYFYKMEGG